MKRPIIAIIGRPNVGKSTLFNRLIGRRQAIVQDEPGVTRDRHYTETTYGRHTFTLVDTGGFDPTAGPEKVILSQIRDQTLTAIDEADILIAVFDGRAGLTALDEEIVSLLRPLKKPVFYAVNKIDTPRQDSMAAEFFRIGSEKIFPISSERGGGVDDLIEAALSGVPRDDRGVETDQGGEEIPRIAVVGRPNVGKSTLINALLGEERLVTSDIPGTTRDAIDSRVEYKGKEYLFIDTAGIRRRGKVDRGVERFSLSRSNRAIKRSDLAVILIDAAEGVVEQDTKIIGAVIKARRACLILVNKWDLREGGNGKDRVLSELQRKLAFIPFAGILYISALKKTGLNAIFREIDAGIKSFSLRIPTGRLNRAFEKAISSHPPPQSSRKAVKLNYITQAESRPPAFVIFSNRPEGVKQPYIRYLENSFRESFDFTGTPLVFHVRRKEGVREKKGERTRKTRKIPHKGKNR